MRSPTTLSLPGLTGLDPAIQLTFATRCIRQASLDRRVQPGDDNLGVDAVCPCGMETFPAISGFSP